MAIWVHKYSFNILSVEAEVIRKRKEVLKEEKQLDRIQAKRNLDFLDILLFARVCCVIVAPTSDFIKFIPAVKT